MYILGVSCFYHDAAAALIKDGEVIAAAQEERFSRKKHDSGFPHLAIEFCLKEAGITGDDLDYVVFYEKPLIKFVRILQAALATFPQSWANWREAIPTWINQKLWIKNILFRDTGVSPDKVLFCDHHLAHAASAFFASPFNEAAVLTIDGVGEWTTTTLGTAKGSFDGSVPNEINLFAEQRFPHSIGLLYSAFTAWLGFKVNNGEYKVMGMAPYGTPKYVDKVYKTITVDDDGSFKLNMDYFAFHRSHKSSISRKFIELFGEPRVAESEFFTEQTNPEKAGLPETEKNQYYADVAASIQQVTEDILIKILHHLHAKTGMKNLVMAGGVALNSKANYRLLFETPFEELFIQPAAGDDGGALGAALWAYHMVMNQPRKYVMTHPYYGSEYSDDEIRAFLESKGIQYESFADDNDLIETVADAITQGKVIGWFQGRFEWGPRALGNRSILADPTREEMKEIVNAKIKFREPFRPFAPVIMAEHAEEYFEFPEIAKHTGPRYMLMVAPIKPEMQAKIPATAHGGTGRLQWVDRETNQRYYDVIKAFYKRTGVPVLLNTSFNLRGEPIVTTPENAYNTFSASEIDLLVLGPYLVRKP
ncbi:MAG: carbamoyltransferase [Anaerolineales bacterium]|nr:carbamoyltransferase [Anaerolineales bacterium]